MMRIIYTLLLFGFCFSNVQAQLNDYKYIIIPKKFDAFKKENQYLTSTLVKHLFSEKGFNAIYDDALPAELNNNRCLALRARVEDESSMFATKAVIVLLDCQDKEVFKTEKGTSKEKEYKLSYNEALRNAFKSFDKVSYAYTPGKQQVPDVKSVQEKTTEIAEKKEVVKPPEVIVVESEVETKPEEKQTIQISETGTNAPTKENTTAATVSTKVAKKQEVTVNEMVDAAQIWYAQEIANGFQLVDSTPKVRLKIFQTSRPNIFISENEKGGGLLYQNNGEWILEYYDGAVLKKEIVNIKF